MCGVHFYGIGEMGKTSVLTFSNLFWKISTEGAVTAVAGSLEYLVGVSSKAATSGREKKQVRINIQRVLEYLEVGNEVIPKSLQGMKAQLLQCNVLGLFSFKFN